MSRSDEARRAILASVRQQLAHSQRVAPGVPPEPPLGCLVRLPPEELAPQFVTSLQEVGGQVHDAAGPQQARAVIARILEEAGAKRVAWSDAASLAPLRAGCTGDRALVDPPTQELLVCDAGICTAQWGIAETGTLVLTSDQERHRLVSLLPPLHIAVLCKEKILGSLAEVLDLLEEGSGPCPAITFITGPSRTADIELTLVIGVHGPRALHVVLLP